MGTLSGLVSVAPSTQILTDGYTLEADNMGFYSNMRFWFLGRDLGNFSAYAAGAPQTITIVPGVSVTRLIPLQHPIIANCYCDSIKIYPPDGSIASPDLFSGGINFSDFFADIHFSTPQYNYESGATPTVTVSLQGGSEMVTRPGTAYKMLTDNLRIAHDVGVPVQTIDFALTMHRLPQLNLSLYKSLAGTVGTTGTTFFGLPGPNVLYQGPGVEGQFFIAGYPSFDCTHAFQYRGVPHNQIMRSDGATGAGSGFDTPVLISDGTTRMIPDADHNQLWGQ